MPPRHAAKHGGWLNADGPLAPCRRRQGERNARSHESTAITRGHGRPVGFHRPRAPVPQRHESEGRRRQAPGGAWAPTIGPPPTRPGRRSRGCWPLGSRARAGPTDALGWRRKGDDEPRRHEAERVARSAVGRDKGRPGRWGRPGLGEGGFEGRWGSACPLSASTPAVPIRISSAPRRPAGSSQDGHGPVPTATGAPIRQVVAGLGRWRQRGSTATVARFAPIDATSRPPALAWRPRDRSPSRSSSRSGTCCRRPACCRPDPVKPDAPPRTTPTLSMSTLRRRQLGGRRGGALHRSTIRTPRRPRLDRRRPGPARDGADWGERRQLDDARPRVHPVVWSAWKPARSTQAPSRSDPWPSGAPAPSGPRASSWRSRPPPARQGGSRARRTRPPDRVTRRPLGTSPRRSRQRVTEERHPRLPSNPPPPHLARAPARFTRYADPHTEIPTPIYQESAIPPGGVPP
jgi:hypothetical protein